MQRWAPSGPRGLPQRMVTCPAFGGTTHVERPCPATAGALEEVGVALLAVWRRNARSARLATPLLRLADALLAGAGLGRLQPPASAFPGMRTPATACPCTKPCMSLVYMISSLQRCVHRKAVEKHFLASFCPACIQIVTGAGNITSLCTANIWASMQRCIKAAATPGYHSTHGACAPAMPLVVGHASSRRLPNISLARWLAGSLAWLGLTSTRCWPA